MFFVHPRETITFHYERDPADPRIAHQLTLAVDAFGNVLRSAAIGYGRRRAPIARLLLQDQTRQTQLAGDRDTARTRSTSPRAPIRGADVRTTRCPSRAQRGSYEVTGVDASADRRSSLCARRVDQATAQAQDIAYEAAPDGSLQRRLIEHVRTLYRRNDLSGALPLGQIESLALPFESSQARVHAGPAGAGVRRPRRRRDAHRGRRRGTASPTPTGGCPVGPQSFSRTRARATAADGARLRAPAFLRAAALARPLRPRQRPSSYDAHDLLPIATRRRLDNTLQAVNDYRVLQPRLVTDPNGNRSEAAFDTLGMVVGTAVMGKADRGLGDSLQGFDGGSR